MTEHATQDHDEIIAWVQRRSGYAAAVTGAHRHAAADVEPEIGVLRVGFPGYASEEALEPLSWDAFFETFDDSGATFYYYEQEPDGTVSHRYRIA